MLVDYNDIVKLRPEVEELLPIEQSKYNDDDNQEADKLLALSVYDNIDNLDKGWLPTPEHIAKTIVAAQRNVQFRDFLMGLHTERETTNVGAYLEIVGGSAPKKEVVPIISVLSTYNYIIGDKTHAADLIKQVLEITPDYSLARLLSRVYPVMDSEGMREMAAGLHPKVKRTLGLITE